MMQLLFRFIIGGAVVSLFAVVGDLVKPKSFAGLFGAAPSVALATLGMTILTNGKIYAAIEARSMILGAIAFLLYAVACTTFMVKWKAHAASATIAGTILWLGCALGLWLAILR